MSGGGLTRKMHIKSRRGGREGGGEERQLTIQITKENGVLVLKVDVEQLSCYVCISEDTPEGGREGGREGEGQWKKSERWDMLVDWERKKGEREGGRKILTSDSHSASPPYFCVSRPQASAPPPPPACSDDT